MLPYPVLWTCASRLADHGVEQALSLFEKVRWRCVAARHEEQARPGNVRLAM